MKNKKTILVFGGGDLQLSIIYKSIKLGLDVVVIDPNENAPAGNTDVTFLKIGGDDFEGTCEVVEKYNIDAIITAATDKPLLMMARIAEKYNFPFFSFETAKLSTDKYLMKQVFIDNNIPCANGFLVSKHIKLDLKFPMIIKPRDNSGSKGVVFCENQTQFDSLLDECLNYTHLDTVLCEEVIYGKEYSVESVHINKKSRVIQITEKITTYFPFNVEISHLQPADISETNVLLIQDIIENISKAFGFDNCMSHTELKINQDGVFVLETSPRLGGDHITSILVPNSTGIDMETMLIRIACKEDINENQKINKAAGIIYLTDSNYNEMNLTNQLSSLHGVIRIHFDLSKNVRMVKSSHDRVGYIIFIADNRELLLKKMKKINSMLQLNQFYRE